MKKVSVEWELGVLKDAVDAATLLAEGAGQELDEIAHERLQPIAAVLTLVSCRLTHVGRVLRGELEPWTLTAPHNQTAVRDENNFVLDTIANPAAGRRAKRSRSRRRKKDDG